MKKKEGRLFATMLACVVMMLTIPQIIPGIQVADTAQALAVGALLGITYLIIRPILRLLTLPLGCMTFGLFHFALDVGILYACAYFIEGFVVADLWSGVLAALVINAVIGIVGGFKL